LVYWTGEGNDIRSRRFAMTDANKENIGKDNLQTSDAPDLSTDFPYPTYDQWRATAEKELKNAFFREKMLTETYEGITLQPIYQQSHPADPPHVNSLPGFPPYVRSTRPLGCLSTAWDVAQEISYPTAEEFNSALRSDLENGQTAVILPLDRAGCLSRDPDQARPDEVGCGGVSISSLDDLSMALEGIDMAGFPLYAEAGCSAITFASLLAACVRRSGEEMSQIRGCIGADPLGRLAAEGHLPVALDQAYDEMHWLTDWAVKHAPRLKTISVQDYAYDSAGASAVEGLAFSIATAVEYLRRMESRGLLVNATALHVRFCFSVSSHFFMEIAKLRAARLLWANALTASGGNEESRKMNIHVRTSWWDKTIYDPHVNLLRNTAQAFAGILGGCDSLQVGFFDETVRQPDEFSRRIARNTQLILRHESHLDRVVDPAGGSWFVEALTDEIAGKAWQLFQEVERRGGMLKALMEGLPQQRVAETAAKRADALAKRKDVLVGTNKYANQNEKRLPKRRSDAAEFYAKRVDELRRFKISKDHEPAVRSAASILASPSPPGRIMERLIDAALRGATIGELTSAIRPADSEGLSVRALAVHRGAEPFESIRKGSEAFKDRHGSAPKAFLAAVGVYTRLRSRMDFATEFFQVGGYEVISGNSFETVESAAEAAVQSGAPVVVICVTDDAHPESALLLARRIKEENRDKLVVLIGYPKDDIEALKQAGVDEFIHAGADSCHILSRLAGKLGISP
jgi:methylmalonyl-CoA mutase